MPNFLLTVFKVFLIFPTLFAKTLANLHSHKNTHYNRNYKINPIALFTSTMAPNNQYASPIHDSEVEPEAAFHDTVQRGLQTTNSNPGSVTSVTSKIQPTALLPSSDPLPPTVVVQSNMKSITIGGLTIDVETTEQIQTTTGALYTKAIRKTYDDDKKGKLDLLKLVQSKQQQPYVATSISVNDPRNS
jgi:hypothetical protein